MERILSEIVSEVERQRALRWKDSYNTCGLWAAYIASYATRWAMPASFDPKKYTFRACMIKVAALCVSAIQWWDDKPNCPDYEAVSKVNS